MEEIIAWVAGNKALLITIGLLVADKVVTMTDNPWDDLIITSIKKSLGKK